MPGGPAADPRRARVPAGPQGDAFLNKWGMSRGLAATLAAVGLGTFLLVWSIGGRLRGVSPVRSSPEVSAPMIAPRPSATLAAQRQEEAVDPIVAESKRFIERESRHAGLPEPPVSSDGKVYLQGGGSISKEQYRDAQHRVRESPVLRTPLPPPPMP